MAKSKGKPARTPVKQPEKPTKKPSKNAQQKPAKEDQVPNKPTRSPTRIVRIVRRSSSGKDQRPFRYANFQLRNCYQEESQLNQEAVARRQREIDRKIAAHPNAWSRGRMVPVSIPTGDLPDSSEEEPPRPVPTPPPRSPTRILYPSWLYRRVTRRVIRSSECDPGEKQKLPELHEQRKPLPASTRCREPDRSGRHRRGEDDNKTSSRPHHERPRDGSGNDRKHDYRKQASSGESPHRVHFAKDTKDENNQLPTKDQPKNSMSRDDSQENVEKSQAHKDKSQAHRDQKEFDARKKAVRHKLHKGAGAFELDGHASLEWSTDETRDTACNTASESSDIGQTLGALGNEKSLAIVRMTEKCGSSYRDGARLDNPLILPMTSDRNQALQDGMAASTPQGSSTVGATTGPHQSSSASRPELRPFRLHRTPSELLDARKAIFDEFRRSLEQDNDTKLYRTSNRSSSSNRSSGFTTPTQSLLVEDRVSPSQYFRSPQVTEKSIFSQSRDTPAAARTSATARRPSSASRVRSHSDQRPPIQARNLSDPLIRRISEALPSQSSRMANFWKHIEKRDRETVKRQQSADAERRYHDSMMAHHRRRSNSDTRYIISAAKDMVRSKSAISDKRTSEPDPLQSLDWPVASPSTPSRKRPKPTTAFINSFPSKWPYASTSNDWPTPSRHRRSSSKSSSSPSPRSEQSSTQSSPQSVIRRNVFSPSQSSVGTPSHLRHEYITVQEVQAPGGLRTLQLKRNREDSHLQHPDSSNLYISSIQGSSAAGTSETSNVIPYNVGQKAPISQRGDKGKGRMKNDMR